MGTKWKIVQEKSASLSIVDGDETIALLELNVEPYAEGFEEKCRELLANARLIAAAPRMVEALKELLKGSELDPNNPQRVVSRATPSSEAIIKGFEALAEADHA